MTDLSDFGAGIDRDNPNPEDELKQRLSGWLRGEDRSVRWERERSYGNATFSTNTRRRPDLLIESKTRNYAVEVKRSEDSAKIHDGCLQAFEYWKDIVDGKTTYSVKGKSKKIDAVLIASDQSPEGHLFHNWKKKDEMRPQRSEGAQRAASIGQIPQKEHATSETAIRLLHRFAKNYDDSAEVGIGALLSSALDGDDPHIDSATPAALFYAPGGERVQNWEYIPFYLQE